MIKCIIIKNIWIYSEGVFIKPVPVTGIYIYFFKNPYPPFLLTEWVLPAKINQFDVEGKHN